jgi:hypothetical protein
MKTNRRLLRKTRHLSTPGAAQPNFLLWLNAALRDERWRAVIRDRLIQAELAEIQF